MLTIILNRCTGYSYGPLTHRYTCDSLIYINIYIDTFVQHIIYMAVGQYPALLVKIPQMTIY